MSEPNLIAQVSVLVMMSGIDLVNQATSGLTDNL